MAWSRLLVAASLTISVAIAAAGVQAQDAPKPPRAKLTKEQIHEMWTKWRQNQPKLKACRADARKKGLAGDDRWFFIEDCMGNP